MNDFTFNIQKRESIEKPFVILYGPAGVGKTSMAANAKRPVFLQTENGGGELSLVTLKNDVFKDYDEFMAALRYLYQKSEEFDTVVIDSLDHLEPIVWKKVCDENDWKNIESPGFGKGYFEADLYWRRIIDALNKLRRDRNLTIVAIAHDMIKSVNDPTAEAYDGHDLKLHKRAVALWKEHADIIGLIRNPVSVDKKTKKVKGGVTPTLFTRPNAAYTAKTRFDKMPGIMPLSKENSWKEFAKYIPSLNDDYDNISEPIVDEDDEDENEKGDATND